MFQNRKGNGPVSCNKQRQKSLKRSSSPHFLIEEANDLATDVLAASLLVVHDALGGGQHDVTELTAGEQVAGPHLDLVDLDIEAGGDATALVQATNQIDNDLSGAVVVHNGDVTNVA